MNDARWVDETCFGTVRRYLFNAKSPVAGVWFVTAPELLPVVAATLEAGDSSMRTLQERQLRMLLERGQLRPGTDAAGAEAGLGFDLERIADDRRCEVIYLPPIYLVHVPGLTWERSAGNLLAAAVDLGEQRLGESRFSSR